MSHPDSPASSSGVPDPEPERPTAPAATQPSLFHEAFDAAPEALLIVDAASRAVVAANASWRAIFAEDPAAAGAHLDELALMRQRPELPAACLALAAGETIRNDSVPWAGTDGRTRVLELTAVAFRAGHGRMLRVGIRDVTLRHDDESRARIAEKIEALRLLAGSTAHDFNNVLSCVRGYVSVALETPGVAGEIHEILTRIRDASMRAGALPQRLLEFSRHRKLALQPLDLAGFVRSLAPELRAALPPGVAFDVQLHATPLAVLAHEASLKQALTLLLQNAREAIAEHGTVTLSLDRWNRPAGTSSSPSAAYARLHVHDSGRGLSAAVRARLFEPGFTTKKSGGTAGMGLATAYRLAEQHGGWIEATGEEGRGSTFTLVLPLATESATAS